jgi:hypothetical protein
MKPSLPGLQTLANAFQILSHEPLLIFALAGSGQMQDKEATPSTLDGLLRAIIAASVEAPCRVAGCRGVVGANPPRCS